MKYNKKDPLTFIHIPKTGGTSVRNIFEQWFGNENIVHCYSKETITNIQKQFLNKSNIVLYGHFNRANPCIPELKQLITILREPLECSISEYFHRKRTNRLIEGRDTLVKHICFTKHNTLTDRVSFNININNYKDVLNNKFLAIGVKEKMHKTLNLFADVLKKPCIPLQDIPQLNVAPGYDEELVTLTDTHKEIFYKNYKIEKLIYDYIYNEI